MNLDTAVFIKIDGHNIKQLYCLLIQEIKHL